MDDRRISHLALATLLAATACMTACSSAHPSARTLPSTTVAATNAVRAEPPVPPVDKRLVEAALAQWRSLTAGHTVTYTASSECIVCSTPGRWKVVERDGALVSAEPLDGQDPSTASLVPTVTHVFATFDADPQISGDEGDITAENIVLS